MTYHDKRLAGVSKGVRPRKSHLKLLLEGASSINLWPSISHPRLGTVAEDWEAVGRELRKAIADFRG